MILGYAVTVLILAALILYLVIRARNLRAELRMLETIEKEGQPPSEPVARTNTSASGDALSR
jgi:hypothetical protein